MSFLCTSCGACCRRVRTAVENVEASLGKQMPGDLLYFPYGWDKNGSCDQLLPNNRCGVYDDRPLICSVDRMAELLNKDKKIYYAMNAVYCNQFQEEDGVDESYRVKV